MSKPETIMFDNTKYVRTDAQSTPAAGPRGPLVLIRSRDSGVHVGELLGREGTEVRLANARRIWYWKGAFTLSEVSQNGVAVGSRISIPIPEITVLGVCEVIQVSTKAVPSLTTSTA